MRNRDEVFALEFIQRIRESDIQIERQVVDVPAVVY